MRKDITVERLTNGGEKVNKSVLARQYNCCWETIDRRLNLKKYRKEKKIRVYTLKLEDFKKWCWYIWAIKFLGHKKTTITCIVAIASNLNIFNIIIFYNFNFNFFNIV